MYKPMGGRKNRLLNVWVVFFFVAIWHDIEMKLLVWGALNSVFFVIEVRPWQINDIGLYVLYRFLCFFNTQAIGRWVGQSKSMQTLPPVLRGGIETLSAAAYIIILIAVNLIGYAIGTGGVQTIASKLVSLNGLHTVVGSFYFLGVGVCIMNWLKRHGYSS
jgi:protein-cysteine N-palmitoyltransferase HHAT